MDTDADTDGEVGSRFNYDFMHSTILKTKKEKNPTMYRLPLRCTCYLQRYCNLKMLSKMNMCKLE